MTSLIHAARITRDLCSPLAAPSPQPSPPYVSPLDREHIDEVEGERWAENRAAELISSTDGLALIQDHFSSEEWTAYQAAILLAITKGKTAPLAGIICRTAMHLATQEWTTQSPGSNTP